MSKLDYTKINGFTSPALLCGNEKKLLVAYSGGADSSLLLHLAADFAAKNGLEVAAAHVSHGIRGAEGERDRDHCIRVADELKIRCFVLDSNVPEIARLHGTGIEETAREVRYDFFEKLMREEGFDCLLTAHNADDNLETMIFRLARGTSARGFCGIAPLSDFRGQGKLIRPILSLTKREILDICDQNGIEYVYDSTNSDTDITRNLIRAKILPVLREINPKTELAALGLASDLREDCGFMDAAAENAVETLGKKFSVPALSSLDNAILRRILVSEYERICKNKLERVHIDSLIKFIRFGNDNSPGFLSLPGKYRARIECGFLSFEPEERFYSGINKNNFEKNLSEAVFPLSAGQNICGDTIICVSACIHEADTETTQFPQQIQINNGNIYNLFTQVAIKSATIDNALCARTRRPSDKIDFGTFRKDVRKLFSERKLTEDERKNLLLICDKEGILWIPGIGVAQRKTNSESGYTQFAYYKKSK